MGGSTRQSENPTPLSKIRPLYQPTVTDQVFEELQQRILSLALPPRTKMSESDTAKRMGVSRQPVREAFKRLARLGFLVIRPQSGTMVSLISEEAVLRARFIRTALEVKTCRTACATLTPQARTALINIIDRQKAAMANADRNEFLAADEAFHREICIIARVEYVWDLLQETKAHMDRIRMLSLDTSSRTIALQEHIALLDAFVANDPDAAEKIITDHISRILVLIKDLKAKKHSHFTDTQP
ncbi:MAG: GntR family transcriptional regulator [Sulfitobacter sp.]